MPVGPDVIVCCGGRGDETNSALRTGGFLPGATKTTTVVLGSQAEKSPFHFAWQTDEIRRT